MAIQVSQDTYDQLVSQRDSNLSNAVNEQQQAQAATARAAIAQGRADNLTTIIADLVVV